MRKALRDNGLSIGFGLLFLAALVGQAFAGQADFNDRQLAEAGRQVTLVEYVTSSDFAVDVAENWQSEYLQFFLYVFATVWLVQRGSPESKLVGKTGTESDEEQKLGEYATEDSPAWARAGGWRTAVFSRSLGAVMGALFVLSWLAQSIAGRSAYNAERLAQLQDPLSWLGYVGSADFWNRTLQNWQSEFLAIGSIVVVSIYLRQRGSPESKPVGDPHDTTQDSG
ncbi:DUF6766 family protein [Glycomyces sp. MUSA5-2]|uniref:DUF6766 family protein n=1 Tax=Glycomyces sp. MUSA5-2 TaxID=2053002 RepID=UPI00300A576D